MIILKNVCKQYEEHIIFRNLNMEISDGELIALTGSSRSGKTTLLVQLNLLQAVKFSLTEKIFRNDIIKENIIVIKLVFYFRILPLWKTKPLLKI